MIHVSSIAQTVRLKPWQFRLLHSSDQARLFWITHGQGRAVLDGRRCGITANCMVHVPAGQPFLLDSSAPLQGHVISVPSGKLASWPQMSLLVRARDSRVQAEMTALVDALRSETDDPDVHHLEAAMAYASLLGVYVTRQNAAASQDERAPKATQRLMQTFLNALEEGFHQAHTVAHYADLLDVTPTHLSRACKTHLGYSAADLVAQRALFAARVQLERSDLPIKEITQNLGFGSAASFSRFVSSHTGQSPSDLRKSVRETV